MRRARLHSDKANFPFHIKRQKRIGPQFKSLSSAAATYNTLMFRHRISAKTRRVSRASAPTDGARSRRHTAI